MNHHPLVTMGESNSYEHGVIQAYREGAEYFLKLSLTNTKFWRVNNERLEYSLLRHQAGTTWELEQWYEAEHEIPIEASKIGGYR